MIPFPFQQGQLGRSSVLDNFVSPMDMPGLLAWYDASDTSTLTLSGSKVTAWSDKSGNSYNLSQATDANRLTTGGTVNSLNALTGDGGDFMNFTSAKPALATGLFYIFVVGGQTANCIYVDGNGSGANPYAINPRTGGVMYASLPDGDILGFTGLGAPTSNGSINLMGHVSRAAGSTLYFNSSSHFASGVNDGFTPQLMFGRSGFQLNGTVCEVFMGNGYLPASLLTKAMAYLKAKWATP